MIDHPEDVLTWGVISFRGTVLWGWIEWRDGMRLDMDDEQVWGLYMFMKSSTTTEEHVVQAFATMKGMATCAEEDVATRTASVAAS